jgi:zinc transporter
MLERDSDADPVALAGGRIGMATGTYRVLAPAPVAAAAGGDAGDGLMFAWLFLPGGDPVPLRLDELSDALALPEGVVWTHLNASASRAKQWLLGCEHLPEPVQHDLLETDERTRLEPIGDAILGVIGDVVAGADPDPWRLSTLRFFAGRQFIVSTRRRPVSCASKLARTVRDGRRVTSTAELMVGLLRHAAESVGGRARELGRDTDRTEDEVLAGHVAPARQRLGKARRRAAQLRRQVTLRPRAIDQLRARLPSWLGENDRYELLDVLDLMETLVDELNPIEQREGALESEIAARLGEETNPNLYILSVVTVIFLPMTLITGIFGMNVAGLPGLENPASFWWVTLSMVLVPAILLVVMRWRGHV